MNTLISNKLSRVVIMALFSLLLFVTGCQKDDKLNNSLDGTTWKVTITNGGEYESIIATFQQSTCTFIDNSNYAGADTIQGTYTYDPPNIGIHGTVTGGYSVGYVVNGAGTVSGNEMTLTWVGGADLIFTKQ